MCPPQLHKKAAYINNYQDDPVETTIEYENQMLFGGNPVSLPARRGYILPLYWQLNKDVNIHYVTSEIVEIMDDGSAITLKTAEPEFFAELSLSGYGCDQAETIESTGGTQRVRLHRKDGLIMLSRIGA
jgi:hypothetical protein